MVKVAIIGASGYTGAELIRILALHSRVELAVVTSRQYAGQPVDTVFPSLRGICQLSFVPYDFAMVNREAEIIFTALPHQTAIDVVASFYEAGKRVIDLSADYRFTDASLYESWYQKHHHRELLAESVYGLPELNRAAIAGAAIVGNPGCYPTGVILALAPLLRQGCVDVERPLVIDAKSGTSGAGRGVAVGTLFCEVNESLKAYKIGTHRHQPEIAEQLLLATGRQPQLLFVPHLVPMNRGILSTIYVPVSDGCHLDNLAAIYEDVYQDEFFVRLLPAGELPTINAVRGANYCDLGLVSPPSDYRLLVVVTAIDNLVKGAAGQAVQNMNIMLGFDEQLGLQTVPFYP